MHARALRRQVLLSTTMVMGALTGYSGRAYAACTGASGVYTCSGAETTTQTIAADNATVSTVPGFSVNTATGNAVTISGDGALFYTDVNASALTATADPSTALYMRTTGDDGGIGSLTIDTNGALTGVTNGLYARNDGSGLLSITTGGDVAGNVGIKAKANGAGGLALTTGAGTTVTGGVYAVTTAGAATIVINGNTTGGEFGVLARNEAASTDLNVTTAAGTTVSGETGIATLNTNGALTVTANGDVAGTVGRGIAATNYGTDLSVTTAAGTTVTANGYSAIEATNYGSGKLDIVTNGDLNSASTGIRAINYGAGGMSLTTGAGTTVTASGNSGGIYAENYSGAMTLAINGDIIGDEQGILAKNIAATDLSVTTAAGTTVSGETGIGALASGGTLKIAINGDVTGTTAFGLLAGNTGGSIEITVGKAGQVTSNGVGDTAFAIETGYGGATNLIVAGTVNGGGGTAGAIQFSQEVGEDDRLELHPTATINGNVLAGPGSDTLAFGGTGNGTFNLSNIDTGANTEQYRNFEVFEVDSGTWSFSGATSEEFAVEGGTLKGTGTFGGLTVSNGATVAPGNSIGTMRVNGAFTLSHGAVYEVELNAAGQNDKVIVNGTVNLTGATLRVLAASGNYKDSTDYVIIENDGSDAVNGVFAKVTSSLAFLIPTVVYNGGTGNDVVLTLVRNEVDPCDVANTPDERATCNAIGPDNPLFSEILRQTAAGARQAFDALSGEIHATVSGVLADDSRYVREAVLGRLMQAGYTGGNTQVASLAAAGPQVASLDSQAMALGYGGEDLGAPSPSPLAFWTRAYGAWGNFNGDGNAATADRDLGGFVSGMDAQLSGSWRVGLATGASFSNVDVDARYSSADVESYHLGGYTGGMAGAFALRGGGMWAWSDIDTSRAVVFPASSSGRPRATMPTPASSSARWPTRRKLRAWA